MTKLVFLVECYGEDDETIEHELPGKYEVCDRCKGHGTHLNPSIGEHAFTVEEFNELFHEDEEREQYFKRGGIYDVQCEECNGARVVMVPDEAACSAEQLETLDTFRKQEAMRIQLEAEDRRTMRRECGEW